MLSVALAAVAAGSLITVLSSLSMSAPLPDLIAAINGRDQAAIDELVAGEDWVDRIDWLMATGATLSVNGCTTSTDGLTTCQVHNGNDWFFSRAAPRAVARHGSLVTTITFEVIDEEIHVIDWPLPAGLAAAEDPFRRWVLRTHPDRAGLMWRSPTVGDDVERYMVINGAAGRAHFSLGAEYLRLLNPPPG
ncbi:MAG: hypothetical protein HKN80_12590 [Acidimicrobiia bacterium]|nr:hypothetical protein [Acidimicrobiia bacterium]